MRLRSVVATGIGIAMLLLGAFAWLVPAFTVGQPDNGCVHHPATHSTTLPPNFRLEQTPQGDYNPWLQQLTCTWLSDTGEPFTRTYWVGGGVLTTFPAIVGPIGVLLVSGAVLDTVRRSRQRKS